MSKLIVNSQNKAYVVNGNALEFVEPYDAEIEYLQANGEQWINTDIIVNDTDTITSSVYFLSKSGDNFVFGQMPSSSGGGIWEELYGNSTWYVRFGSSSSSSTGGSTINTKYTTVLKKNYFSVDGTRKLQPNYTSMPNARLRLFRNGANTSYGNLRLYYLYITDANGNKRLDLIPVRIGSVGYMYDKVSGKLLGNNGSGSFTLGTDKQ